MSKVRAKDRAKDRAKNLDDKDIEIIVGILDGWAGKLTWDMLIDEVEVHLKERYTRQTLGKHVRVKEAFDLTKERLGKVTMHRHFGPADIEVLVQRLERLENENVRLDKENQVLLAQFARWSHNSYMKGIVFNELDKPLPKIDRGQDE